MLKPIRESTSRTANVIFVMSDGGIETVNSTKNFLEKMLALSNLPTPSTEKET